jgi:hypothetical protein
MLTLGSSHKAEAAADRAGSFYARPLGGRCGISHPAVISHLVRWPNLRIMLFSSGRTKLRGAILLTVITAAAALVASLTIDLDHDGVSRASAALGRAGRSGAEACGSASAAVVSTVDVAAARRIYSGELYGGQVRADIGHVVGSQALLSAMAASNMAAVQAAVHGLVYAPHWHIVRLRVLKAGKVLADVGGPYIIAPVTGPLKWHGRPVGSYVMSVQDDVGFVKLVSRFIGTPVAIYRNGSFLMGTLKPAPHGVRTGATVTIAGSTYRTNVMQAGAFPSGSLQIALFAKEPAAASGSCRTVRSAAYGSVAAHIAARFKPLPPHYKELVDIVRSTTNGVVFIRAGSKQLAGGAGPARLPLSGTVTYRGRSWSVFSFEPVPPARIFVLTPTE